MEKTKHRFNFIDVLIIIAILALSAVLVKIFIIDEQNEVREKNAQIQYVLCTDSLSEEMSDNVTIGDSVFDYSSGKEIGKVTACDVRNATYTGTSADGTPVISEIVGKKVLYITVETTATVYDDGYLVGGVPIRAEKYFEIMFPKLYCEASCISIEVTG